MVTKFVLRPQSLPFTVLSPSLFFSKLYILSKPPTISPICTASAAAITTVTDTVSSYFDHSLPYGPSLHKGQKLSQSCLLVEGGKQIEDNLLDEESFTRVYDLTALRVPSEQCFSLENRLRGHLLNWPRIRNIARVPGDEVEEEFQNFIKPNSISNSSSGDDDSLASLNRRIYGKADGDGKPLGPVLYRDKLAKTFNSKGFVNFRHLAKISRPKKKKTKNRAPGEEDEKRGIGKNDIAVVEVVEEESEEDGWEDLSGLLGSEFKSRKWRGSTRLLLLDERYANKRIDEMPKAIQAVLNKDCSPSAAFTGELVRCKLTLFYKYWQMNEILEVLLPNGMVIPSAFETVGHISHLNLRDEHLPYKKLIAKVVLDKNKPKIQSVVNKVDAIHNDYRTMQLEVLAGNSSLVTTVVENGLRFHVDLATVYWNSRLATERQRLLTCFTSSDVVCDIFSGVGPIAISAARIVKRVYANDLNPRAVEYLERNAVLNKLERKIEVFNMDGRRFIEAIFASERAQSITHVVMNLPNDAAEYLDAFRGIFKQIPRSKELTSPTIHVYGFSKAQDPEFDFLARIRIALLEAAVKVEMHRVRLVAPGKWMLCASFILPERVAFAKAVPKL